MQTDNYLQMLIDSLQKKQKELVTAEGFDEAAFQKNVDEKDALIENMLQLDEGFNTVFARVREQIGDNKAAYREEITKIQGLIRAVTDLGVRIEAQEARNKALVQSKFASIRKELQNAKRSTQMTNTYYKSMNKLNYEPQFMDQKK